MNNVNEAVETIIRHKADRIINSEEHTNHIKEFLYWRGISFDDIPMEVFKICAVDAMIYDVGAALDLPEFKRRQKRRRILEKIFAKK